MANNEQDEDRPVIPPLVRSPYPTRSRSRRRQLEHQRMLDDQLTADPLGLAARTQAQSSTPESTIPPTITRRRRQPRNSDAHSLFSTPGATTATANATMPPASHTSITSDYMIGKGLVQARISPMAGNHPSSANSATRRRRFFPPSRPSPRASTGSSGMAAAPQAPPESAEKNENGSNENTVNNNKSSNDNDVGDDKITLDDEKDVILHGMNITRLRELTLSCLGMGKSTATQSPKMAVFFAGMVHSKTKAPKDAYIYARALVGNDQPKRAVKWIEQSNLLRCYYSETRDTLGEDDPKKTANAIFEKFEELKTLQVESLLLAAQALSELSDWTAVLQLLEDTQHCTFPENHHEHYQQQTMDQEDTENSFHPNHMTIVTTAANPPPPTLIPLHLDDDDEIAWQQLADSLRPSKSATMTPDRIHPLSRICQMRARAYSELGHPLRANLYWNRALQIDPWCVLALEGLLETSVQSPANVVESVLQAMSSSSQSNEHDDAEWLRALYLARVCTAAPNTANVPTGGVSSKDEAKTSEADDPMEDDDEDENMVGSSFALTPHQQRGQLRSNNAENESQDPSFWQDASSIQLLTPIPQQQSVADMSAAGASLFLPQASDHATAVASEKNTAAAAVGSALDTLWNKFQLRNSPEVLAMAAQNAYRRYDWNAALQYCEELSAVDPLSSNTNKAAFCHVSTLVQLNRKRPLFKLAHEWVETSPKEARSWFAVASYYYACERYHIAQRHFCRATRLDPHCVEAWLAFGASFAACDESDQALASFRAAQRLAPGNHTSLLYIGMEYLRTNHLVLAQHFLKAANESSGGTDPLVKSETGVLKLNQRKYSQAITWFLMGLGATNQWATNMAKLLGNGHMESKYLDSLTSLVETVQDPYWEPTLFNLAHAYRKERLFDAAVICLEQCLALKETASAHSALGYCLHLQSIVLSTNPNNKETSNRLLHRAIDSYHQSLAKKPDDPFASEMLQKALTDALDQTDFFLGDDAPPQDTLLASPKKTPRPPRQSLSSSIGADQSSLWTEDGLSIQSGNDDVDMG